jgi:hypothetical protein
MVGGGCRTLEKRNKQHKPKKDSSENRNRTSDLRQTELKTGNITHRIKMIFFIENQQEYIQSAEVTALPPSFDWKLQIVYGSLLN